MERKSLHLTPFVSNEHRTACMEGVCVSSSISVEIPPKDGSVL